MSGEFLFKRKVVVLLARPLSESFSQLSAEVIDISALRVSFKVAKSLVKDPNTAEIKIYNLSEATRAKIPGTGAKVVLKAGYEQTIEQIFIGDARSIESKREGAEWVTTIKCGDGERAVNFARVNESFGVNALASDVITKVGQATGLDTGNLAQLARGGAFPGRYTQGYVASGRAVKELEKALTAAGYELSIQDGSLLALQPDGTTTESVIELSSESGLIGSPEVAGGEKKESASQKKNSKGNNKPVLKARSLLQGGFRCGRRTKVVSRQYNGLYKILKVEHTGDTAGGDFYSDLEMELT